MIILKILFAKYIIYISSLYGVIVHERVPTLLEAAILWRSK